jgi:hypothetical protein
VTDDIDGKRLRARGTLNPALSDMGLDLSSVGLLEPVVVDALSSSISPAETFKGVEAILAPGSLSG